MTPTPLSIQCYDDDIIYSGIHEGNSIRVYDNSKYRWLSFDGVSIQSLLSLEDPGEVMLPYIRAMLQCLALKPMASHILNLGFGCGTIERFISRHFPAVTVDSVESSPDIVSIARQYFFIPENCQVTIASAERFISTQKIDYDVIFCDLHEQSSQPVFLYHEQYYDHLSRCLRNDGVIAINLLPDNADNLLRILTAIRKHFRWQYLLEFDDYKNIVLFAAKHPQKIASALASVNGINIDKLTELPEAVLS